MTSRYTLSVLAVALVFASANQAGAQETLLGPGAAFISAGAAQIATGALDDRLVANGYPSFGRTARSLGIGAYRVIHGNIMLGGELNGLVVDEKAHLGAEVGLGGGHATLGVAYVMDLSPKVRIYPRLGLGAGGIALWIERADTATFDDVLANPAPASERERVLSRDGGVIDLGLGLELIPNGRHSGVLLGLRAGYLFTSFGSDSNWQMTDGTATSGPSASISGAYIRLVLGGAWMR